MVSKPGIGNPARVFGGIDQLTRRRPMDVNRRAAYLAGTSRIIGRGQWNGWLLPDRGAPKPATICHGRLIGAGNPGCGPPVLDEKNCWTDKPYFSGIRDVFVTCSSFVDFTLCLPGRSWVLYYIFCACKRNLRTTYSHITPKAEEHVSALSR